MNGKGDFTKEHTKIKIIKHYLQLYDNVTGNLDEMDTILSNFSICAAEASTWTQFLKNTIYQNEWKKKQKIFNTYTH